MICRSVTAAFAAVSAFFIPATALLDGHQISAAVELGYLLRSLERFCLIRRQVSMPTFTFRGSVMSRISVWLSVKNQKNWVPGGAELLAFVTASSSPTKG